MGIAEIIIIVLVVLMVLVYGAGMLVLHLNKKGFFQ